MSSLCAQLGHAGDEAAIALFRETHRPLAGGVQLQLHDAVLWSPSQTAFRGRAILDDADRADVADTLNAELHATGWTGNRPPVTAFAAG